MSFSNPKLKNPASKFIEFKGEAGKFQYYDHDTEKNVEIPLPIYFVVLDELHTVRGYNKTHKSGVFANEVRNIKNDLLNVRVFKSDIQIVGKWDNIKGEVERIQGSYSQSVYGMMIIKDTTEMVNFQMTGAMRSPWFDFKVDKENSVVGIVDIIEDSNGAVTFKRPVFKRFNLKPDLAQKAFAMDQKLQEYLKTYLVKSEEEVVNAGISEVQDLEPVTELPEGETKPDPEWLKKHEAEMNRESLKPEDFPSDLPFGFILPLIGLASYLLI